MTAKINQRYALIDALRGFSLVNMLAFHFLYDVFIVYGGDIKWAFSPAVAAWERFICVSFILISGISLNFSGHAYRRGIIVNICGLIITAVTAFAMPSQIIIFGVLNLIGCSMIITHALKGLLDKINPFAGTAVFLLLFALFYGLPEGYLGLFGFRFFELPSELYSLRPLAVLGLPDNRFFSADYFPLVPWLFLFICGYFLWRAVLKLKLDGVFKINIPVLGLIGRYSLWIYLIHQPLLMGICFLIYGYI